MMIVVLRHSLMVSTPERDELFLDQLEEEPQSLRVIVDLLNGSQEDLEMLYSAILLLLRLKSECWHLFLSPHS